ncbi:MAG: PorT family protein [Bacteroidales bacterium]|nr:PorT family protein [Bacteroidales bacterium]
MKRIFILTLFFLICSQAYAQHMPDSLMSLSDEYLDTVVVFKQKEINDYSMIGFSYGAVMSRMIITPYQHQENIINPGHYAVTFTHYSKMFDYLPYFGFQLGVAYSWEGMQFKYNKESGYLPYWDDGTSYMKMRIIEVPFHAQIHFDAPPFKAMVNAGIYGAYRMDIDRRGDYLDDEFRHTFHDYEIRWDYGLEGGLTFAYMLDPVEIHLGALVRYSWGSLFQPDYHSEYYYRYCYPFDIMFTAGVHFQITKRSGKTTKALKKEAKTIVYGE